MLPILLSLALLGYGVSVAENPYTSEGLSVEELVELLQEVGFPEEEIPEAVRVIALESKGVPGALQEEADDPAIGCDGLSTSTTSDVGTILPSNITSFLA